MVLLSHHIKAHQTGQAPMTIHIAAYKGSGKLVDKAVRLALSTYYQTPVPYAHVELMKGPRTFPLRGSDTSSQMCLAASKRDKARVRKEQIFFKPNHWDFYTIPQDDIWDEAQATLGNGYDTLGAILCITPWARLHPKKEWCSALIADLAGWKDPELYDPYLVTLKAMSLGGTVTVG
jgi:hypothetical protein